MLPGHSCRLCVSALSPRQAFPLASSVHTLFRLRAGTCQDGPVHGSKGTAPDVRFQLFNGKSSVAWIRTGVGSARGCSKDHAKTSADEEPVLRMFPLRHLFGSSGNCVGRVLSVRARRPLRAGSPRCCNARRPGCGSPHPPHRNAGAPDPALSEPTGRAGRASLGPPLRTAAGLACPCRGTLALTARNVLSPDQARAPSGQVCRGRAVEPEEFARLFRGWMIHARPGTGVSADFAEFTRCNEARQRVPGSPPRLGRDPRPRPGTRPAVTETRSKP